jgi:hypothetical protein
MATPIKATKLLNLLIEPIAESDLKIKSERDYRYLYWQRFVWNILKEQFRSFIQRWL